MTSKPQPVDPRVEELLDAWQIAHDQGREISPSTLCQDCPELCTQLEQQIQVLRHVGKLAGLTLSDGRTGKWKADPEYIPDQLGTYRIIDRIGRGGMGEVYRAEDPALGRQVAVKVMKQELNASPEARSRFLREARAIALIRHDNVVPIYHVGDDGSSPYIVMPLLEGESLETRLMRAAPLPWKEAVRVGLETARGLAAIHEKGLIHRDIKPANLWIEAPSDQVRVLDFGLAKLNDRSDGLSASGTVSGTPEYMSPEQINGGEVGATSDLFSLGVTLYRCVTGSRAFQGNTLTATLRAVAEFHPPPPHQVNPAIPASLSALIMRLIAKNPADRPASAAATADELGRSSVTIDHLPRTDEVAIRPWKKRESAPLAWVAGMLVVVASIGLAAFFTWEKRQVAETPKPSNPSPNSQKPVTTPEVPKYRGSVDVYVYRTDDEGSDLLVPLWDPRAMPLKPNDQVKLVAEVNPPAHLYVFWIDETGSILPAYPWRFGEWGTRPAAEEPTSKPDIRWPNGKALKISGAKAGTETILMLARSTKLDSTDAEVKSWFAEVKPVPFKGERARVWFEDFDILRTDVQRGPGMVDLAEAGGPLGLQEALRKRIGPNSGFSRGVSFSRLGSK